MKRRIIYLTFIVLLFTCLVGCKKEVADSWLYEYELQSDNTYKIIKASANKEKQDLGPIYIPLTYQNKKVTTIGSNAFMNNVYFTDGWYHSLHLGENITKIEENAFNGMPIGSIEIKENVRVIEANAFNCYNYIYCFHEKKPNGWDDDWASKGEAIIFNYLERKSNDIFNYVVLKNNEIVITRAIAKEEKAQIIIPKTIDDMTVSRIANTTFKTIGWSKNYNYIGFIEEITLPETITVLEKGVFEHLDNLKTVSFSEGNGITKIEENAFRYCSKLETFEIGSEVLEIEKNAFYHCYSLEGMIIPLNVEIIGENAFDYSYTENGIYCVAESKPVGWSDDWSGASWPVVWGYTGE